MLEQNYHIPGKWILSEDLTEPGDVMELQKKKTSTTTTITKNLTDDAYSTRYGVRGWHYHFNNSQVNKTVKKLI